MMFDGWRFAGASAIGTSHVKAGLPCQDNHSFRTLRDATGKAILALTVADGAGSAERSQAGSQLACSKTLDAIEEHIRSGGRVHDIDRAKVQLWLKQFQDAVKGVAESECGVPRDYACTLLVAVVAPDCSVFWQVGDGAIVVSDENGDWCWVFWPQHGEYANSTNFATDESSVNLVELEMAPRRINDVAMFSDGLENLVLQQSTRTVHGPFFEKVFRALWSLSADGYAEAASDQLARLLESPQICARTDDDKTLVLASRGRALAEKANLDNGEI